MSKSMRSKKFLAPNKEKQLRRKVSRRTKRHVLKVQNGGSCCGGCKKSRKRNIGPRPLKSSRRKRRN